jgi:hypothetical protein
MIDLRDRLEWPQDKSEISYYTKNIAFFILLGAGYKGIGKRWKMLPLNKSETM